jgi:hypothetical protein
LIPRDLTGKDQAPASDVTSPNRTLRPQPPFNDSKIKPFCATLCRHRGFLRIIEKSFSQKDPEPTSDLCVWFVPTARWVLACFDA